MVRYSLMRILYLIPVMICVSFIVFSLLDLAPGSAVELMLTDDMSQEDVDALRALHMLDRPMVYRYGRYMMNLFRGDLGVSDVTGLQIWDLYIGRFPVTFRLSILSLIVAVAIAIPLGILAAKYAGTIWDNLITGFTLIGLSMPTFWQGLLFLIWFSFSFRLFPASYDGTWQGYVLPVLVTGTSLSAIICRQTRSAILEVARQDYIRTARAKGVPEIQVTWKHKMRNAWIPVITQIGVMTGMALAGSAVVETVFTVPGVGRMMIDAINTRDITMATGTVILTTAMFVLILLVVDILYAVVDPRIRAEFAGSKLKKKKKGKLTNEI